MSVRSNDHLDLPKGWAFVNLATRNAEQLEYSIDNSITVFIGSFMQANALQLLTFEHLILLLLSLEMRHLSRLRHFDCWLNLPQLLQVYLVLFLLPLG